MNSKQFNPFEDGLNFGGEDNNPSLKNDAVSSNSLVETSEDMVSEPEKILNGLITKAHEIEFYSENITSHLKEFLDVERIERDELKRLISELMEFSNNFSSVVKDLLQLQKADTKEFLTHLSNVRIIIEEKYYSENELLRDTLNKQCVKISETSKEVSDINHNVVEFLKKRKFYILGALCLPLLMFLIVTFSAFKWFQTAVQTRQEVRQELQEDIINNGKDVYEMQYVKKLEENTKVMQLWLKKGNAKATEDFMRFKTGFEARAEQ